ncbi:hypothetical protein, partial [Mitsuokella multacida]|uniref:hypothetical protein n=1 Tax=Mitsuokella multacida TaxID=52226 RepID=UPI003FED7AA7
GVRLVGAEMLIRYCRFLVAGISISLGFSMAALPAANIDTVLAEADCHMYKEKVEHHKTRHQHQATDA